MTDERPTQGGAANMPPFPRASHPEASRPATPQDAASPSADDLIPDSPGAPSDNPDGEPTLPQEPLGDLTEDGSETVAEADSDLGAEPEERADPETFTDASDDTGAEPSNEWDEASEEDDFDESAEGGSFRSAVTSEIARRAEMSVLKGMEHVADTFEQTAHRIHRMARLRGGPEALSIGPVHSTVGWLEGAADYLRSSDLEVVQSDLRQRVRSRPVQSLGIALCAGWLIGRILR